MYILYTLIGLQLDVVQRDTLVKLDKKLIKNTFLWFVCNEIRILQALLVLHYCIKESASLSVFPTIQTS